MKNLPKYLFVCTENACRSQMAEGLFNHLTKKAIAQSAGTAPAAIHPLAIEVMRERGIDLTNYKAKLITPELAQTAVKVITMGCLDGCPFTSAKKTLEWDIPDPKGKPKEFFIKVRDLLEEKIKQLLQTENLIS